MKTIKLNTLEDNLFNYQLVQKILAAAPLYSINVSGEVAGSDAGKETFTALPANFERSKKKVIGIYLDQELIGVIDFLIGYPTPEKAYIGLFLLNEKYQGQGLGSLAYAVWEKNLVNFPQLTMIRIAVVESNFDAFKFWQKLGFKETGERKPYENNKVISQSILMEKS